MLPSLRGQLTPRKGAGKLLPKLGRRAIGMPWPARQMEVISPSEDHREGAQEEPEEEEMRLVYSFAHHDGWFKGWLSQETMGGAQTFE
jgi:hypothetical protein